MGTQELGSQELDSHELGYGTSGGNVPLAGRTAVVTGAASGIGRAGALAFAAKGARVVVADIHEAGANETVAMIEGGGGRALAVTCDVTDEDQVQQLVSSAVEHFGSLDVAWNNAGGALPPAPIHEMSVERWKASVELNLTSMFICLKHELIHMLANGGGCIVNTASGAARVPAPGRSPYSASKRGVVALTAHAAQDYLKAGIRVNAVLPGLIDTPPVRANLGNSTIEKMAPVLPLGRMGDPSEVADLAVWLCTDEARFVNGQAIVVDGGGILA